MGSPSPELISLRYLEQEWGDRCSFCYRKFSHSRGERSTHISCRNKRRKNEKLARAEKKKKGICIDCTNPAKQNRVRCEECLEYRRISARDRRLNGRQS